MAGCGVPDTTPAPEIVYQYAQGAQKGQTATQKKKKNFELVGTLNSGQAVSTLSLLDLKLRSRAGCINFELVGPNTQVQSRLYQPRAFRDLKLRSRAGCINFELIRPKTLVQSRLYQPRACRAFNFGPEQAVSTLILLDLTLRSRAGCIKFDLVGPNTPVQSRLYQL